MKAIELPKASDRSVRAEVSDILLDRLLRDPRFLAKESPLSEDRLSEELDVAKSALREAVIGFIRSRWLVRSDWGINRDTLDADRLIFLYGMRLHIERMTLDAVVQKSSTDVLKVTGALKRRVNEQEKFVGCDEADWAGRVQWFRQSVAFHVTLVSAALSPDWANILEGILWQIRIGACFPLEDPDVRNSVTDEHKLLIEHIDTGDHDRLSGDAFIEKHLKEPMGRALRALGIIKSDVETPFETKVWHEAVRLAPSVSHEESPRRRGGASHK